MEIKAALGFQFSDFRVRRACGDACGLFKTEIPPARLKNV